MSHFKLLLLDCPPVVTREILLKTGTNVTAAEGPFFHNEFALGDDLCTLGVNMDLGIELLTLWVNINPFFQCEGEHTLLF
jgi:hypothetical protein